VVVGNESRFASITHALQMINEHPCVNKIMLSLLL